MAKYYSEHELLSNMYDIVDEDGCILTVLDEDTLKTLTPLMPVRQPVHAHKCIATSKSGLTMFFECSNCRRAIDYSDVYCKYCGAKMDEVI